MKKIIVLALTVLMLTVALPAWADDIHLFIDGIEAVQ